MQGSPSDATEEARQALRDIRFLYVDLVETYQGFGHGADTGTFDPFRFLDVNEDRLCGDLAVDVDLLRQGSAVALLCGLYDLWNEAEDVNLDHPWVNRLQSAVAGGHLKCCPDIERVMLETFARHSRFDDPWLHAQMQPIYTTYVVSFFARQATAQPRR